MKRNKQTHAITSKHRGLRPKTDGQATTLSGMSRFLRLWSDLINSQLEVEEGKCPSVPYWRCQCTTKVTNHPKRHNSKIRTRQINIKMAQATTLNHKRQTRSSTDGAILPSWFASTHCHSRTISNSGSSSRWAKMASRQASLSLKRRSWSPWLISA